MIWNNIFIFMVLFFVVLNFIFNIFIGLFLVRFQQNLFVHLNNLESLDPLPPMTTPKDDKKIFKTWDQKYEEELILTAEKIAKNSEL